MTQIELAARPLEQVGQDIGLAEGAAMVQAYRQANPADTISHIVGRDIIEQLLAQPGCAGINIASAAKENGERTLVFIGVDAAGQAINSYPVVNMAGQLEQKDAVVADRVRTERDDFWEELFRTIFGF
jgi:hypothetical protein